MFTVLYAFGVICSILGIWCMTWHAVHNNLLGIVLGVVLVNAGLWLGICFHSHD